MAVKRQIFDEAIVGTTVIAKAVVYPTYNRLLEHGQQFQIEKNW
jgi:hypothetical protein